MTALRMPPHRTRNHLAAFYVVGFWLLAGPTATGANTQDFVSLFRQANEAFAQGARQAASDPARAAGALAPAVAAYRELIEQRGLHSAGLHYNLGNAHYLSGDPARAIVEYRRALALDPTFGDASRNLVEARARVGSAGAGKGATRGPILTSWLNTVPARTRFGVAVGAFAGVWVVLLARLRSSGRRPGRWSAGVLAALALLSGGSVAAQQYTTARTPPAVIVEDRVIGRKGPDELGYAPSFTEPLRAGLEVTIIEARGRWMNVRLEDGRGTWVPAQSVERI